MPLVDFADLTPLELAKGVTARVIHTEHNSVAAVAFVAGAVAAMHSHPHEQVTTVIDGRLELIVAGETFVLERGKAMTIPPDAPHMATALTDCSVIDIFCPVRDDLKNLAEMQSREERGAAK